jgi:F0F1-type ATP synthase assembly protein I
MAGSRGPTGTELAGLGLFLAAAFIVPFLAGLGLDALLRTSPLFLFVGLLVGIAAAAAGLVARWKRYQ